MKITTVRTVFLVSAVFNWLVGLGLAFAGAKLIGMFGVTPLPTEPLFLQLFAWLVFAFGIAYYWIYKDPPGNRALIRLGIIAKLGVVIVCLANIFLGHVSWQIMLVAGADLAFAILFWRALKSV